MGHFVSLEGGEGAGKSTLATGIADALRARGMEVLKTREPGGSPGADAIRALLVTGGAERWTPTTEALLFAAARADHLDAAIRPALARGAWVICDRYLDSTYAYQVVAGGLPAETFDALQQAIAAPKPDLTLILDLRPEQGLARSRGGQVGEDRFERKDLAFHRKVRDAFLAIAVREPGRCVVLDAGKSAEEILADALRAIDDRLA